MSTPEIQTAAYSLADILPGSFEKVFARAPRAAQQLWELAVAIRQAEGARLADAVERITPERAQRLRAIDRAQGPDAGQERERAWVDLEALFQIDGSTRETFEGRRAWAAANLQGRNEDAFYRPYDRYVAWGDMRVDRELARGVGSACRGALSAGRHKRLQAVGLDVIPTPLAVWLECIERIRVTCETAGKTAHMAYFANALADVPFVRDRALCIERLLQAQDPGFMDDLAQCLRDTPAAREAAWQRVADGLESYQRAAAEAAFQSFEFASGITVEDSSGWEYATTHEAGAALREMTRLVFFRSDSEDEEASRRISFTVRFDSALVISDVSALDMDTGNDMGWMAKSGLPAVMG